MIYDFIIVGSGPSGTTLASRLASTLKKPSVLLLEAGGSYLEKESLVGFDRWPLALDALPTNWPITSAPQDHLGGKIVDLPTGKALGGSSAINMTMWTVGNAVDYDEWSRRVGDESFNWKNVQRHLKRLENYEKANLNKYGCPDPSNHGTSGEVHIEYSGHVVKQAVSILDAFAESGRPVNPDSNSGDSLGVGIVPLTLEDSWRVSAATAFLGDPPENLIIKTNALVKKVIFEGKKAVGVAVGTEIFTATKEIIISAGALRTPQILMLSGIGPKSHLESLGITCLKDLPVGQTLQDHTVIPLMWEVEQSFSDGVTWVLNPEGMREYREEFLRSGDGPLKDFYCPMPIVYDRDPEMVASKEMHDLPENLKGYLGNPALPLTEICPVLPGIGGDPDKNYLRVSAFPMAVTSVGTVKLASADINDLPRVDPNFFSTPFDRMNAICLVRSVKKVMQDSKLAKRIIGPSWVPDSNTDEDIFEYIKKMFISAWHYGCSVKMGNTDDGTSCLNSDFRVFGTTNLRVADLSAAALMPQCHLQAVGYVIGEIMAEKLTQEYNLSI